jgi:hypothetical protein
VQELADFASGMIIGTLIAMGFRLWAFKRFVFPVRHAQPRPARARRTKIGPRSGVVRHQEHAPGKEPAP